MRPILFDIYGVHFYTLGIFLVGGIVGGSIVADYLARMEHLKLRNVYDSILYITLVGLFSARLTYFVLYRDQFGSIGQLFYFWQGGMVIYGGIIGAIMFSLWYFAVKGENVWRWLDMIVIGFFVAAVFGFIGIYLSGNTFNQNELWTTTQHSIEPILIWQAGWSALAAIVLYFYWRLKYFREGIIFLIGLAALAFSRFVADFWIKGDVVFLKMTLNQTFSLAVLIICLLIIVRLRDIINPNLFRRLVMFFSRRSPWTK